MVNTIDDDYILLERIRRGDGLEPLHDTNRDNSRLRSENDAKRRVMRTDEAFKLLRNAAWLGSNDERDAIDEAVTMACNALANIEQITWERDTAIDQLRMLGYSLGEKPGTDGNLISRRAAIDAIVEMCLHYTPTKSVLHPHVDFVIEELMALPSAEQELLTTEEWETILRVIDSQICDMDDVGAHQAAEEMRNLFNKITNMRLA